MFLNNSFIFRLSVYVSIQRSLSYLKDQQNMRFLKLCNVFVHNQVQTVYIITSDYSDLMLHSRNFFMMSIFGSVSILLLMSMVLQLTRP